MDTTNKLAEEAMAATRERVAGYTDAQKAAAFEWLREQALDETQPLAGVAFDVWATQAVSEPVATQPAEAVADTFERYAAIREGHYNGIVDEYFQAREGWTLVPRGIFKDAFYRGFDARDGLSASPALIVAPTPASASEPETHAIPRDLAERLTVALGFLPPGLRVDSASASEPECLCWSDDRCTCKRASASVAGAGEALFAADFRRNVCPRGEQGCGWDTVARMCVADGCALAARPVANGESASSGRLGPLDQLP